MNLRPYILLMLLVTASGCSTSDPYLSSMTFPYSAPPLRAAQIRSGARQVRTGMSQSEVKQLLGEPDGVRPMLTGDIWRPTIVGSTYWYFIHRRVRSGSANDRRDDKVLRLRFDLSNTVTEVKRRGLEIEESDNKELNPTTEGAPSVEG